MLLILMALTNREKIDYLYATITGKIALILTNVALGEYFERNF